MNQDILILRELAKEYAEIAHEIEEKHVWELHAAINDLHPQRPIALISELPWHELNADGYLTLRCQDEDFRQAEDMMRKTIFQHKYFPGDMMVKPYFPVSKIIRNTGSGISIQEETLRTDESQGAIYSHKYENQFNSIEDVEKIKFPVITYDKENSEKRFAKISEAISDCVPVKLVGEPTGYGNLGHGAWDIISQLFSTDTLLYNMIDEPELMHALVERLTDIFIDTVRQYEELNLIDPDPAYVHSSSAASRDLQKNPLNPEHVKACNVWGRGYAQILGSVSPDMHDEFEIQYAMKSLAPFGLVYYGCCEPLDRKIDIVKKIPNLRKISITPWADINRAADAVGSEYVISAKPNPANLPYAASNPELIRQELRSLLDACHRNNTPCELLLKDISTANHNLENLIVWNRIAMEEVERI